MFTRTRMQEGIERQPSCSTIINSSRCWPRVSGGSRTFFTVVGAFDRAQSSRIGIREASAILAAVDASAPTNYFLGIRASSLPGTAPLVMVLICAAESSPSVASIGAKSMTYELGGASRRSKMDSVEKMYRPYRSRKLYSPLYYFFFPCVRRLYLPIHDRNTHILVFYLLKFFQGTFLYPLSRLAERL